MFGLASKSLRATWWQLVGGNPGAHANHRCAAAKTQQPRPALGRTSASPMYLSSRLRLSTGRCDGLQRSQPSISSAAQTLKSLPQKLQQQALFCNGRRTTHGHPRWHLQGGMAHTGPPGTWARFIWSGWVGFSICSCTQHRTLTKQLHCTVGCTCKHHSRSTNASTAAAAQLANVPALMRV